MSEIPKKTRKKQELPKGREYDKHGRIVFKKGVSGNPDGRPVGARSFTTKVRDALEKIAEGKNYTYEEAFIKAILKKSIVDQDVGMMRTVWEQLDGKPMQRQEVDITTQGEKIIPIYNGKSILRHHSDSKDIQSDKKNTRVRRRH